MPLPLSWPIRAEIKPERAIESGTSPEISTQALRHPIAETAVKPATASPAHAPQ
jgi:hypothetical protein